MGRDAAAGERGNGRRRRLGLRDLSDAPGRQEQRLPARGDGCRHALRARGRGARRRPRLPADAGRSGRPGGTGPRPAADAPGRPAHRLGSGRLRHGAGQGPCGRRLSRRARRGRGAGLPAVRRVAGAGTADRRSPGRRAGHPGRRDPARHARRRGLDQPPEAGGRRSGHQAARGARPRGAHRRGARVAGRAGRPEGGRRLPRTGLCRAGPRGVPVVRLPQRRHVHGAVPPAGRSAAAGTRAAGQGAGPAGRVGVLVQRHPPRHDRGRAEPRRRVLGKYQRNRRRLPRDPVI